ncbi:MAG: hypothetical protein U0694_16120 [Anaerolineae bacterium]
MADAKVYVTGLVTGQALHGDRRWTRCTLRCRRKLVSFQQTRNQGIMMVFCSGSSTEAECPSLDRAADYYDETRGFPSGVEVEAAATIARAGGFQGHESD